MNVAVSPKVHHLATHHLLHSLSSPSVGPDNLQLRTSCSNVISANVIAESVATLTCYVPVTVHREQSVKKGYQQDAKIQMIYCQFQMFIIDYCLDMFRASLWPSSGEKTTCYCILLLEQQPSQCSHPTTQHHSTATCHIQHYQQKTPYTVTRGLFS